ncbi:MAG: HD domain-containing protein, partial [Oscillospiraceae bacterium]|nr:HD domain-containing protein [Oscillospiraceae bacterium]
MSTDNQEAKSELVIDPVVEEQYRHFEQVVKTGTPSASLERVRAAFEYAYRNHGPQLRKSGEPYIIHPLAAAEIIAELNLDEESIMAALLHDCLEDTGSTHLEIEQLFGPDVADIVEGVTKLTRVTYTSKEEEQMENFRKMLLAMATDIRVIIIKLADRLHNMRTLQYHKESKQREKALETMEIYAPIAHRLGMQRFKWELEDLSIRYLDPIGYKAIADELAKREEQNAAFFDTVQSKITERLAENGIKC